MSLVRIHDHRPGHGLTVDLRDVLGLMGERSSRSAWQVAGVARYGEPLMVGGGAAADRLAVLSRSGERIAGDLLHRLAQAITQVIWGEFRAYEDGTSTPWIVVRAIDSSWYEVETDDAGVLERVRRGFADVRIVTEDPFAARD